MKFADVELLEYCDGVIEQHRAELIEQTALKDQELARRIEVLKASNLPYKEAFSNEQIPELPKALTDKVQQLIKEESQTHARTLDVQTHENTVQSIQKTPLLKKLYANGLGVGIAASLALCFFIGYFTANKTNSLNDGSLLQASSEQASWVRKVADYQSLYVENTVSGISPDMAATSALMNKIEQASDIKTAIPDLSEHGYSFVRAQELGYQSLPLVQLVYFKPGKAPLAVCFMPSNSDQPVDLNLGEREGLRTADWEQGGQRFVIVGNESPEVMQSLYESARESWKI